MFLRVVRFPPRPARRLRRLGSGCAEDAVPDADRASGTKGGSRKAILPGRSTRL